MAPLKELESGATGGVVNFESRTSGHQNIEASQVGNLNHEGLLDITNSCGAPEKCCEKKAVESSMGNTFASTRSSLEDMELETRALTEPLPTNQQV